MDHDDRVGQTIAPARRHPDVAVGPLGRGLARRAPLLPDHYGASLPRLDQLAADGQAVVERLRSHPAGGFAQEIYRSERNP